MKKRQKIQGMTLIEACVAIFITMVAVAGSLSALQSAWGCIQEARYAGLVLIEAQSIYDQLCYVSGPRAVENVLERAKKNVLTALPSGKLAWGYNPEEQQHWVEFSWVLRQPHRFRLTFAPRE